MGADPYEAIRSCEGLISQGLRPLTSEERDWLRLRAERLRRRRPFWIAAALLTPIAFIVGLALATSFPEGGSSALLLIFVVALSIFLLVAQDRYRIGPALASAEAETAEVFRRDPSLLPDDDDDDDDDEVVEDTSEHRELEDPGGTLVQELVRIPSSGEVIEINGRRLPQPRVEPLYLSVPPAPPPEGATGSRPLTEAELRELKEHARLGWRLAVSVWFAAYGGLAITALVMGAPDDWFMRLLAIAAAVLGVVSAWEIYQRLGFAWRLRRDRKAGEVIGTSDGERLARSGFLWTAEGVPAAWRVRHRREKLPR